MTAMPSTFQLSSSSISAASRDACAGLRATSRVPPLTMPASMPSRRRDVDDLVDGVVERLLPGHHAVAAVQLRHQVRSPGTSPDSQPPLRPDAPKPAKRASRTTMRSDGSARFR